MNGIFLKIKQFVVKYDRYISPTAFFTGFVWDNFTLRRIDLWVENILFISHLLVIAGIITLLQTRLAQKYKFLPFVLQFSFGALFSGFFVFYSRSASLSTSWPFLLFLGGFLLGNEFFRKKYQRLVFNLSVFFIVLFSYSIFVVPILLGQMSASVFFLSGLVSVLVFIFFVAILSVVNFSVMRQGRFLVFANMAAIFLVFNILYFTNIIPPIPLSLKDIGIYHGVSREPGGGYLVLDEKTARLGILKNFDKKFYWTSGEPAYVYSSVFAPTRISAEIFHRWFYFDEGRDDWVLASQIGFFISGGRDGGYRGYSMKTNIFPGKWRVDVVTGRGQVIGRIKFRIVEERSLPPLETVLK